MQILIRSWLGVSALFFTSVLAAQAPAKQPITHEAMVLMKRVGAPSLSPDGKWAVFSVTEPSYDARLLQRMRVPSRLLVWPEETHWILNPENGRVFYKEVEGWLAKWVKAGPG